MKIKVSILVVLSCVILSCRKANQGSKSSSENHKGVKQNLTEIEKRINFLERMISQSLEEGSQMVDLAKTNAEWVLFTYSFTAFSCYHFIQKDSLEKNEAKRSMKLCIEKVLDRQIVQLFEYGWQEDNKGQKHANISSVLYLGHLNLMLSMYNRIYDDSTYRKLNHDISTTLIKRYKQSKYMSLESYSHSIWLSDNTAAMASLKMYLDNNKQSDEIVDQWLNKMKHEFIHEETGLFYSKVDVNTGQPYEEPRGSMLGWIIFFMNYIHSEYADELFENYKKHFSSEKFGFRLFRERYDNYDSGTGDIDSGPLFMGVSIPANQFALICAVNTGDEEVVRQIETLVNAATKVVETEDELFYQTQLTDFEISPLAEALMLYAMSLK